MRLIHGVGSVSHFSNSISQIQQANIFNLKVRILNFFKNIFTVTITASLIYPVALLAQSQ